MKIKMLKIILILFALLAGMLTPVQTTINATLAKKLGHPVLATATSFIVAMSCLLIVLLVVRPQLPSIQTLKNIPIYLWFGGMLGASFIFSMIYLAPRLGVGLITAIVVTAQILTGVLLDRLGVMGAPPILISWQKVIALVFMGVGVYLFGFPLR
jgi:transporter family-2 protein